MELPQTAHLRLLLHSMHLGEDATVRQCAMRCIFVPISTVHKVMRVSTSSSGPLAASRGVIAGHAQIRTMQVQLNSSNRRKLTAPHR